MVTSEESARPQPKNIATISSGFEKGDFLVREEQGKRLYFDFFEDAFNYAAGRGFVRMSKEDERDWVELLKAINNSVEGGTKYNTGNLLMVLSRPVPALSKGARASTRSTSPASDVAKVPHKKQQQPL